MAWSRGGEITNTMGIRADRDDDAFMLFGQTTSHGGEKRDFKQFVELDWTPCRYGGERVWARCPGCRTRVAVLWFFRGYAQCRDCHGLAYASTRESTSDRMIRKAVAAQRKIDPDVTGYVWHVPRKPQGMHWKTYARHANTIREAEQTSLAELISTMARIDRILDRSTKRRP